MCTLWSCSVAEYVHIPFALFFAAVIKNKPSDFPCEPHILEIDIRCNCWRRRGGAERFPRLRCKLGALPGSHAADILQTPPCTFLWLYNRMSHWREKRTVSSRRGSYACCLKAHRLFNGAFLRSLETNPKYRPCGKSTSFVSSSRSGTFCPCISLRTADTLLFGCPGNFFPQYSEFLCGILLRAGE